MNITLEPMEEKDIPALTKIMKAAFDADTELHLHEKEGGPEGYDDGRFLRKWGLHPDSTSMKIMVDSKLAGGIILWLKKDRIHYLGNLFIDTAKQGKGLGLTVWNMIEALCPDTLCWKTDTPAYSLRNHSFYVNKCGFHVVHIDNPKDLRKGSYRLEKKMDL